MSDSLVNQHRDLVQRQYLYNIKWAQSNYFI